MRQAFREIEREGWMAQLTVSMYSPFAGFLDILPRWQVRGLRFLKFNPAVSCFVRQIAVTCESLVAAPFSGILKCLIRMLN